MKTAISAAAAALLLATSLAPLTAGESCGPFVFPASGEHIPVPEALGKHAQDKGYRRVVTLALDYQGGRDATAEFSRHFKGVELDEMHVPLGHFDFAVELVRIREFKPDAVLVFAPDNTRAALLSQVARTGVADSIPFMSIRMVDDTALLHQDWPSDVGTMELEGLASSSGQVGGRTFARPEYCFQPLRQLR